MFEWLFKYSKEAYVNGELSLSVPWHIYFAGLLAIAVILWLLFGYRGLNNRNAPGKRVTLWLIRCGLISIIVFALLRPTLTTEIDDPIPGQVALLIDDSKSMTIADLDGSGRGTIVSELFAPGEGRVSAALDARYDMRYYRFSDRISALKPGELLRFNGGRSDAAGALGNVLNANGGALPSAVVLVSDGGIDASYDLEQVLRDYVAAGVPVHSVGVGAPEFEKEVEIRRVDVPADVLRGDSVEATVHLHHRGMANQSVRLSVEQDGLIIADSTIELPAARPHVRANIQFDLENTGTNPLVFRVVADEQDQIINNNAYSHVVSVREQRINVLHFEGEPRFEVKFIRRALADDASIRLASLIRTAENKFLRLGVNDVGELADGFPTEDDALFAFDVVILGSADDELLNEDHQDRLRRFVAQRGGSLIALGGAGAFAQGGYSGSPLAQMLPVELAERARSFRQLVKVIPTEFGLRHSALRLGQIDNTSAWADLPPLTVVNPMTQLKPGATALLQGLDESTGDTLSVMASQRYGRGHVLTFAVRDSWRWQMHPSLADGDLTHERLWQQLVRWLGRPVGGRLDVTTNTQRAVLDETVEVRVDVLDGGFIATDDALPVVEVISPLGDVGAITLTPDPITTGRYIGSFIARESGEYDIKATLEGGATTRAAIQADAFGSEFVNAERNDALLGRMSSMTQGELLSIEDSDELTTLIDSALSKRKVTRNLSLLDAPVLFIAILLLAFLEWMLRRRWALA